MHTVDAPEIDHASSGPIDGNETMNQHPSRKECCFRCYAYGLSRDRYIAECLDLDIMVEENTLHKAVSSLNDAVKGYVAVALEGDTSDLVPRKSPLKNRLMYHYRVMASRVLNSFKRERQAKRLKQFDVGTSLCY